MDFAWRPPAIRGDFRDLAGTSAVVVYIDSYMWQRATLTHVELLTFLASGGTLIGAASAGALRAVELRHFGAIGVGFVHAAILSGHVVDDGELLAAVDTDTLRPLTIPLVDVRHLLALMRAALDRDLLIAMLQMARRIYFMERTPDRLLREWRAIDPHASTASQSLIGKRRWLSIKEKDSNLALAFARRRLVERNAVPEPLPCELEAVLFLD